MRILHKAGIRERNILFHALRHTAASYWIRGLNIDGTHRQPVSLEVIKELLGHSSVVITEKVYALHDMGSVVRGFIE